LSLRPVTPYDGEEGFSGWQPSIKLGGATGFARGLGAWGVDHERYEVAMSQEKQLKQQVLQEDDASRFLESLNEDERRPQYIKNSLKKSPETFSDEEMEAAKKIYSPPFKV
jgi:hypothetical protein